ncbi:MAG: hypothetical protein LBD42_07245 [Desulfovibrio sp.]|jgi:hypothetical protein|nr:hypothetical protein [Desulfovibrio sp.]
MEKDAKEALQVTKEIIVKFIETSRVSPGNFAEIFPAVYQVVVASIATHADTRKHPGKNPSPLIKEQ